MRKLQAVSLAIVIACMVTPAFAGAPGNAPTTLASGDHTPASFLVTLLPMSSGGLPGLSPTTNSCDPLCRNIQWGVCSSVGDVTYCSTGMYPCEASEEWICYCQNPGPKWRCTP
jgi:hypothetical protein